MTDFKLEVITKFETQLATAVSAYIRDLTCRPGNDVTLPFPVQLVCHLNLCGSVGKLEGVRAKLTLR